MHHASLGLPLVILAACGSGSSPAAPSPISECPNSTVPSTLKATVSGFAACSCFNGAFTLTESSPGLWSSPAITGCPGQKTTAYIKFTTGGSTGGAGSPGTPGTTPGLDAGTSYRDLALGITDSVATPGSGNSDFAPANSYSCSPLSVHGDGATAGNITSFCPGTEDERMVWVITTP